MKEKKRERERARERDFVGEKVSRRPPLPVRENHQWPVVVRGQVRRASVFTVPLTHPHIYTATWSQ